MKNTGWFGIVAAVAAMLIAMTCTAAPQWQKWPKMIPTSGGQIVVYQPQIETFQNDILMARSAVSVKAGRAEESVFGVVWFESRVDTDRATRTVDLVWTKVTQVKFPDGSGNTDTLEGILRTELPKWDIEMSLDEVLTSLAVVENEQKASTELQNTPPQIIFSLTPAMLVLLDGEPRMVQIEGTDVMRVVNTPFVMVFATGSKTYYLLAGDVWMKARDWNGTWEVTTRVPAAAMAISEEKEPKGLTMIITAPEPKDWRAVPRVIISTEPAELVVIDGEPEFQTIAGTSLLYVSNTDNDLFLDVDTQRLYLLTAGRWFTARQKEGPWDYVASDKLPESFAHIPPTSAKGDMLANVAGTEDAREAVADTYIPQTAAVKRSEAKVTVIYDGPPKFEAVQGTTMMYAVNSPYNIILAEGSYYCCDNAVWFVGNSPIGPWVVCDRLPPVIYTMPPSCPIYHVKYVHIYDSTPEIVYVGYTPGYVGSYVYNGCVVYGTGHRYHGWYRHVYYPRPVTWGFAFRYNTFSGWSIGAGVNYGGCFGVTSVDYVYGGWWGSGGFRLHDRDFHRRDRVVVVNRPGRNIVIDRHDNDLGHDRVINVYNRRGDVVVHDRPGDRSPRIMETDSRDRARNNVIADKQGNVYRRDLDGWENRQQRGWTRQDTDSSRISRDKPEAPRGNRDGRGAVDTRQNPDTRTAPDPRGDKDSRRAVDTRRTPDIRTAPDSREAPDKRQSPDPRQMPRIAADKADSPRTVQDNGQSQRDAQRHGKMDVILPTQDKASVERQSGSKPAAPRVAPDKTQTVSQPDQRRDLEQQMRSRVRGQERTRDFDSLRSAQTPSDQGNSSMPRDVTSSRNASAPKASVSPAKDKDNSAKDSSSGTKHGSSNKNR
jgi:hypothetical protein